jgi:hypothetical protein
VFASTFSHEIWAETGNFLTYTGQCPPYRPNSQFVANSLYLQFNVGILISKFCRDVYRLGIAVAKCFCSPHLNYLRKNSSESISGLPYALSGLQIQTCIFTIKVAIA